MARAANSNVGHRRFSEDSSKPDGNKKVRTLYLLRHGEAVHNIQEKAAKVAAAAAAIGAGYARGSPEYESLIEASRIAVLQQEVLLDAALSQAGKEEAEGAKAEMERLMSEEGLPAPTSIFVSPLQRTLQTAAIAFPGHPGIHVREQLRERRTGLPCDEHICPLEAARRASFNHMSWNNLLSINSGGDDDDDEEEDQQVDIELEDKAKLRLRAAEIAKVLRGVDDECVAIITHKGFLRELERGPLGRPEATEFANCEVRIYAFEVLEDDTIKAELLHCRKPSPTRSPCRRRPSPN